VSKRPRCAGEVTHCFTSINRGGALDLHVARFIEMCCRSPTGSLQQRPSRPIMSAFDQILSRCHSTPARTTPDCEKKAADGAASLEQHHFLVDIDDEVRQQLLRGRVGAASRSSRGANVVGLRIVRPRPFNAEARVAFSSGL